MESVDLTERGALLLRRAADAGMAAAGSNAPQGTWLTERLLELADELDQRGGEDDAVALSVAAVLLGAAVS